MNVAEKLTTITENMPKILSAGQKIEYNNFWDNYLASSALFSYRFAGPGWTDATFRPNQDIIVTGNAGAMFRQSDIEDLISDLGDYVLDLSAATNTTALFYASKITKVAIKISETTPFDGTIFQGCYGLTTLYITGILASSGLDLHWSTKLDKESLLSVINSLQDKTSTEGAWTITFGSTNLAKLTDAEKAIATQKGWTLT